MFGGRKVRSNKGKKRVPYGSRTGKTRSGRRFRTVPILKKTRKVRSNKGKKRGRYGPRTGKTRSGKRFRLGGGGRNHNEEMVTCGKYKNKEECYSVDHGGCHHETLSGPSGGEAHIQSCVWKKNKCISSESEKFGVNNAWVNTLKCKASKPKKNNITTSLVGESSGALSEGLEGSFTTEQTSNA